MQCLKAGSLTTLHASELSIPLALDEMAPQMVEAGRPSLCLNIVSGPLLCLQTVWIPFSWLLWSQTRRVPDIPK